MSRLVADTRNISTGIANQLGADVTAKAVLRWLGMRDTLAELRFGRSTELTEWSTYFESAVGRLAPLLSPRESNVFHARYNRQLSIRETAMLLSLSRQAVNTYGRRIAAKLVKLLNTSQPPDGGDTP